MTQPRRLLAVFALFLALAGGGCALLEKLGLAGPSRPVFSHTNHTEEQDLACKDCHPTYAAGDAATMPKRRLCILCHEGIDEKKPPEQKIANLFGDPPPWTHVTQLSREVIYSHRVHYEAKIECAECHHDVTKIEDCSKAADRLRVSMQTCVECHARQPLVRESKPGAAGGAGAAGAPAAGAAAAPHPYTPMRASRAALVSNDCAVCHREIRKDAPPPNHRLTWKRLHGPAARDGGDAMANRCSLCHTEASCSSCHREEEPASHTHFWKERGHGVMVGIDRSACAVCHRSDFCDRCHRETAPRSHVGAWGAPRDNHCYSCHGLSRGQGCGMCHRGAPGHLEAGPKPSWHNPGMNCRSCHFPVPHADNGMDCNACHR